MQWGSGTPPRAGKSTSNSLEGTASKESIDAWKQRRPHRAVATSRRLGYINAEVSDEWGVQWRPPRPPSERAPSPRARHAPGLSAPFRRGR
jgi:hypothetical protein